MDSQRSDKLENQGGTGLVSQQSLELPVGVTIRTHKSERQAIQVAFSFKGEQCREVLKGRAVNKINLKFAGDLVARIRSEIADGSFRYLQHFPRSPRARRLCAAGTETVKELLTQHLEQQSKIVELSTWKAWNSMAQTHIVPGIGDRKVRELKTVHIQAWIKSPKMHGLSLKSIRNMMTPLRGALFLAIAKELRDDNPAVGEALNLKMCVKKEFHSTGWEPDPLNVQEIGSLLKACDSVAARNFFQLAFATGLRTGEIIALKWSDIDFKGRTLTVQRAIVDAYEKKTKTRKGMRVIDLSDQAIQALRAQQQLTKDQPLIFYHPRTLLPLKNSSQVRNLWVAAIEKAEIRYRSPYQTRHTYASQLITSDPKLNLFYLADQMGHVGLDMINRHYGRWIRGNGKATKRRR